MATPARPGRTIAGLPAQLVAGVAAALGGALGIAGNASPALSRLGDALLAEHMFDLARHGVPPQRTAGAGGLRRGCAVRCQCLLCVEIRDRARAHWAARAALAQRRARRGRR